MNIRARRNLEAGSRFVVVGDEDVVILKRITAPTPGEFDGLIKQARAQARSAGLKKSDIDNAVKEARNK